MGEYHKSIHIGPLGYQESAPLTVGPINNNYSSYHCVCALQDEATLFSYLDHPNILKMVGICMETPNLALVLEFMDMSLYEALHIKTVRIVD